MNENCALLSSFFVLGLCLVGCVCLILQESFVAGSSPQFSSVSVSVSLVAVLVLLRPLESSEFFVFYCCCRVFFGY